MKEITVEATIQNVPVVTDFINEILESADCPMKTEMQIDVCIDEIFSNIALYAYGEGTTGKATVCADVDTEAGHILLTFLDEGIPFNPLEREDPDTTLSADQRTIGGLGIFIVKKTMDEVTYTRTATQNILSLKKTL